MNSRIWQREQAYRRRLCILTPIAAVLMTTLFLVSDRIPFRELEKHVGWQGEMHLLPEITIIPDDDQMVSEDRQRRVDAMTSVDLDLTESGTLPDSPRHDNDQRRDEDDVKVALDEYDVRTVQAAREVPYSQDYVILKMVEPRYPSQELKEGVEGNVTVELLINENGRVEKVSVLSAIGPESFELASLEAVRQFIFQPPVQNGKPTSMWIKFLIKFRIFG